MVESSGQGLLLSARRDCSPAIAAVLGDADAEDDGPAHGMGVERGDMIAEEIGPLGQDRGNMKMELGILRHDGDGAAGRLAGGIQDLDLGESHRLVEAQQHHRRRLRQYGTVRRVRFQQHRMGAGRLGAEQRRCRKQKEGEEPAHRHDGSARGRHRCTPRQASISRRRPPASGPVSGPAPGASDPRRIGPGRESRSSAIRPWRIPGSPGNRSPRRACRAASR